MPAPIPTPPPAKVPIGLPFFHQEIWTATEAMFTCMVSSPMRFHTGF